MSKSNLNKNQNPNPKTRKKNDPRYERVVVGYRLVPMRADQVDEIARAEGRDRSPKWHSNVVDKRLRCPWCFLKGGVKGKHFCRWRTADGVKPLGGKIRQVPIYEWRLKE